jgi:ribosomal protein S18 acetylase RimI-like enzyme
VTTFRWRRPTVGELATCQGRLATWDCDVSGAVRHMFPLACLDASGVDVIRVAGDGADHWALAVVHPGRVLIPCGDPEVIAVAGTPTRRWRLLVGDVAAAAPLVDHGAAPAGTVVHVQRFFTVDPDRVPDESALPDPGLRRAEAADVEVLGELAVQLHVDDEFGPPPSWSARRGYRDRMERSVEAGLVWVVGPVGQPVCKVERSVSSPRWGVQLAGIVVDPARRNQGIGRAAVAAAVREALREVATARPISLHVRAANTQAHRAYEAAGFVDREEWRLAVRP